MPIKGRADNLAIDAVANAVHIGDDGKQQAIALVTASQRLNTAAVRRQRQAALDFRGKWPASAPPPPDSFHAVAGGAVNLHKPQAG